MKKIISITLCLLFVIALVSCAEEKEEHYYYDIIVYVSEYDKIHSYPNCSNMVYYTSMPLSTAVVEGYVMCKKCEHDIYQAIEEQNKQYYETYYDYYDFYEPEDDYGGYDRLYK